MELPPIGPFLGKGSLSAGQRLAAGNSGAGAVFKIQVAGRSKIISFALLIGVGLFLISLWLHLSMIRLARVAVKPDAAGFFRHSVAYIILLASHPLTAAIFAAGFAGGSALGLGGFEKELSVGATDLFYFSLINITTLGLGDIFPTGHLRALAGIESLTGFLLISCSAQFLFATMKKQRS